MVINEHSGLKKGDRVRDNKGYKGTVQNADDPHNIEVKLDNGGFALYCIVYTCPHFDVLKLLKEKVA